MSRRNFEALNSSQLAALRNELIKRLQPGHIRSLSAAKLTQFKPARLALIPSNLVSYLKAEALNELSKRQVRAFALEQVAGFSRGQLKAADGFTGLLSVRQRKAVDQRLR